MKLFLSIIATFYISTSIAQVSANDIFPVPVDLKMTSRDDVDYELLFAKSECVSGDCKNGQGIWLTSSLGKTQRKDERDSKFGYKSSLGVNVICFLLSGAFTHDGRSFNGKISSKLIKYEIKNNSKNLQVLENYDLLALTSKSENLDFEGKCTNFLNNGSVYYQKKEGFNRSVQRRDNTVEKQYDWYIGGVEDITMIYYSAASKSPYKNAIGRRDKTGKFFLGRFEYKNGAIYTGFLFDDKRQGSGVYKSTSGSVDKGLWVNDELEYQMEISIPKAAYDASNTSTEFVQGIFDNEGEILQGGKSVDKATGITFFVSDSRSVFYHGYLKDNKPDVLGSYLNLQVRPDKKWPGYTTTPQVLKVGLFKNFELGEGLIITAELAQPENNRPSYYADIYMRNGGFENKQLTGCGWYSSASPGKFFYREGDFKNAQPVNWYFQRSLENNKWTEEFLHPGFKAPYNDADYTQMQRTIVPECLKDKIGNLKLFVLDFKQEQLFKQNKSLAKQKGSSDFSSIVYTSEKISLQSLQSKYNPLIYVKSEKKALYFKSYNPTSRIYTLEVKTYNSTSKQYDNISLDLPAKEQMYYMRPRVSKDEIRSCTACRDGIIYGSRKGLVRKPGLRYSKYSDAGYGYYDPDKQEYYHYDRGTEYWQNECSKCKGTGKVKVNYDPKPYDLLEIY